MVVIRRLLPKLPAGLMLLVACTQMLLAKGLGLLAPSHGGGFGMFSTVDGYRTRGFYAAWRHADGSTTVLPNDSFKEDDLKRLQIFPSHAALQRFGAQIAREGIPYGAVALHLEIARQTFDPKTATLGTELVTEIELPVARADVE